MYRLKRGPRPRMMMNEKRRQNLIRILNERNMTVGEAAELMGLKYFQFYAPLTGRLGMKQDIEKKIERFEKSFAVEE